MGAFIVVMLAASFGIVNTLLDSEHTSIEKGDSIDMETKGGLHMFEVFKKNLVDIIYNFQLHLGKLHLSATIICVIIVTAVVTCGVGKYYMMALLNIIENLPGIWCVKLLYKKNLIVAATAMDVLKVSNML